MRYSETLMEDDDGGCLRMEIAGDKRGRFVSALDPRLSRLGRGETAEMNENSRGSG